MNIEVHLQRIINGKTSYNLAGIVPNIEADSYEEASYHPKVQEMINKAYGKHFLMTMYAKIVVGGREGIEVTSIEVKNTKRN